MQSSRIADILTDPVTVDLLEKSPLLSVAYTGIDGAPRVVPVSFIVRDQRFIFCTASAAPKVAALQRDPRVALTVDIASPPCCLLVRGVAEVEIVHGVPTEFLDAALRNVPTDMHDDFTTQVRNLYDSMARIVVTPSWTRLIDFQRTAPQAVERLAAAKA
jgi:hypothetical protein